MSWVLRKDEIMPAYWTYEGHAEECEWEFTIDLPEQLIIFGMEGDVIQAHVDEFAAAGHTILRVTVYRDTSPTWSTNYRMVVISTASAIAWVTIIARVVLVIGIIVGIAISLWLILRIVSLWFGPEPPTDCTYEGKTYLQGKLLCIGNHLMRCEAGDFVIYKRNYSGCMGTGPYVCPLCESRFETQAELDEHMTTIHAPADGFDWALLLGIGVGIAAVGLGTVLLLQRRPQKKKEERK